mmetsp:Transcript_95833/g.254530  ORF Transcript_95833/g.254530 Transcript_95833/m.254530 type:complete len:184 (-) Transcript_95833:237-788(-)
MSVLASETQKKVVACRAALEAVEGHLEPLLSKNSGEVARQLAPLEHAELQVSLAYAVASVYFCHLLTQGTNPAEHPLKQELDRIQLYFKKVRSAADEAKKKQAVRDRGLGDSDLVEQVGQEFLQSVEALNQESESVQATKWPGKKGAKRSAAAGDGAEAGEEVPQRPKKLRKKGQKKAAGAAA